MNIAPPPETEDVKVLRQWCNDLYESLKYPAHHVVRFVPRATRANPSEGDAFYDSDTNLVTVYNGSAWISLGRLDGVTASVAELNVLDDMTASTAELNLLDDCTSSTAELNILTGVTATAAELNILDDCTATTTDINTALKGDGSNVLTLRTVEFRIVQGSDITCNLVDAWNAHSSLYTSSVTGISKNDNGTYFALDGTGSQVTIKPAALGDNCNGVVAVTAGGDYGISAGVDVTAGHSSNNCIVYFKDGDDYGGSDVTAFTGSTSAKIAYVGSPIV